MFRPLITIALFAFLFESSECTLNRGMTWTLISHDSSWNIDSVGCQNCNAYVGDTSCNQKLPVLCYMTSNLKRPPYNPVGCTNCAMPREFYDGWSGGLFALTNPVFGSSIKSKLNMISICQSTFGNLFTAANHQMGRYVVGMNNISYFFNSWPSRTLSGGWGARGYGNLPSNTRFWVYIEDQKANCWDR